MNGAAHRVLPDGRLHLQHGPIDMILRAEGPGAEAAHRAAVARFQTLLAELVAELPLLRQPVAGGDCPLRGAVARRMAAAARAHLPGFVTPMAAVAGAGAEAVLQAMAGVPGVVRAFVNNGGDIALFFAGDIPAKAPPAAPRKRAFERAWKGPSKALSPGPAVRPEPFRLGVVVSPEDPASPGVLTIAPQSPFRGVATSGARGRSHSLGIADSVTVIARRAPQADVAATLIANATDLPGDPAISREPADSLSPDSDLGARLVTTHVPPLDPLRIDRALDRGEDAARRMLARGLIGGALIVLQGTARLVGEMPLAPAVDPAQNSVTHRKESLLHV